MYKILPIKWVNYIQEILKRDPPLVKDSKQKTPLKNGCKTALKIIVK